MADTARCDEADDTMKKETKGRFAASNRTIALYVGQCDWVDFIRLREHNYEYDVIVW